MMTNIYLLKNILKNPLPFFFSSPLKLKLKLPPVFEVLELGLLSSVKRSKNEDPVLWIPKIKTIQFA